MAKMDEDEDEHGQQENSSNSRGSRPACLEHLILVCFLFCLLNYYANIYLQVVLRGIDNGRRLARHEETTDDTTTQRLINSRRVDDR
jgi:hypothetical protein